MGISHWRRGWDGCYSRRPNIRVPVGTGVYHSVFGKSCAVFPREPDPNREMSGGTTQCDWQSDVFVANVIYPRRPIDRPTWVYHTRMQPRIKDLAMGGGGGGKLYGRDGTLTMNE